MDIVTFSPSVEASARSYRWPPPSLASPERVKAWPQHFPLLGHGSSQPQQGSTLAFAGGRRIAWGKGSRRRAYFTGTRRPRMLFVQVTIVTWRNAMVHLITRSHISASGWKVYIQALLTHNEAILRNGQKDELLLKHVLCLRLQSILRRSEGL